MEAEFDSHLALPIKLFNQLGISSLQVMFLDRFLVEKEYSQRDLNPRYQSENLAS